MTALAALLASGSSLPKTPPPDVEAEVAYLLDGWHPPYEWASVSSYEADRSVLDGQIGRIVTVERRPYEQGESVDYEDAQRVGRHP